MKYVELLLKNQTYTESVKKLAALEQDRSFCRHNMSHFMDVARLAQIRNIQEHKKQEQEMIYLYALLHDIGRIVEYEKGISHAKASADFAGEILVHIGYPVQKCKLIQGAIQMHRNQEIQQNQKVRNKEQDFAALMRWADKASRMCFCCEARAACNWEETLKNREADWM